MRHITYGLTKARFSDPNTWQTYIYDDSLPSCEGFSLNENQNDHDYLKSGEVKLILAIFAQCLNDIAQAPEAKPHHIHKYRLNSWRFHSAEAQLFMDVNNPALIEYCDYLQTTPERIVDKFKSQLYKLRRGIKCTA